MRRPVLASLALALALGASGIAFAQADKVVATVDGAPITEGEVTIAMEDLGDRVPQQAGPAQRRDYAINYLIDLKSAAKAAREAKVGEGPDFARRLAYYQDKVLVDELVSRTGKAAVTPEAARKLFDDTLKTVTPEEEVRARHILVDAEDVAKTIVTRLTTGKEDFAKIANELSKDPGSKADGGDLGWFTRDRMVTEFAEAAFKLKPGEISTPVKSQFGWHVIRLEERRTKPLPKFEDVSKEIDTYLMRKAQEDLIVSLRAKAKVERLDKPEEPKKP
jgi:peptidyl-prolyl cis-trans isomerase C